MLQLISFSTKKCKLPQARPDVKDRYCPKGYFLLSLSTGQHSFPMFHNCYMKSFEQFWEGRSAQIGLIFGESGFPCVSGSPGLIFRILCKLLAAASQVSSQKVKTDGIT